MEPWSLWTPCTGVCGTSVNVTRMRNILHKPHPRHLDVNKECKQNTLETKQCIVKCNEEKRRPERKVETSQAPASNAAKLSASTAQSAGATGSSELGVPIPGPLQAEADYNVEKKENSDRGTAPIDATPTTTADFKVEKKQNSDAGTVPIDAAPTTTPAKQSESFRTRLDSYYRKYNPEKLATLDDMLNRYEGREEILFSSLVAKYGPEPESAAVA